MAENGEEGKEYSAKDVGVAIGALREKVEKYGADSKEAKEMNDKVNVVLESNEKKHGEIIKDMALTTKALEETKERIETLEKEIVAKSTGPGVNYKETPEFKALNNYVKKGFGSLEVEEQKVLRVGDSTAGGSLTIAEMDDEMLKNITEISSIRQVARVKVVSNAVINIPKRDSIPTATFEGETQPASETQSAYGNEQLVTHRQTAIVPYTEDLFLDSKFDIITEINGDVSESFAQGEGLNFVLGNGVKKPEGFMVHADIVSGARPSAASVSGTVDGDDLLLLAGDLKTGYKPMYGFNRKTLAYLRTLKGSNGQYIWQVGLGPAISNTIGGMPYIEIPDLVDLASNSLSVIYADFLRGYRIHDRTGLTIIRDELTQASQAIVLLTFRRYLTGQVVLPEAFKALKSKT